MLDESRDPVKRDATVIADDSATTVGVGESGEDVRTATRPDVGGGAMAGGRGGSVRTLERARRAVRVADLRMAEGRDRYTGR